MTYTTTPLGAEARTRLQQLLANPVGRRIGVLGLGVSGTAMARHLARRKATVVALDSRADAPADGLRTLGMDLRLGPLTPQSLADLEALCISPGVDPRQEAVQGFLGAGKPVLGELELAGKLPVPVIAITGTNGKSTTTALCGALVQNRARRVFVGGNFGTPVVRWLDEGPPADVAVLELSSYQLETAYSFAPEVGVVLNVTPDHLDRYANLEAYAQAKETLVRAVPETGTVVLNADDPQVVRMATSARGRVLWFSCTRNTLPGDGAILEGGKLVGQGALSKFGTLDLAHPRLLGLHNRENAMAALLAVHALGLAPTAQDLRAGYLVFSGLEHRLEWVAERGGVTYINDSKATNDASAAIGLQAIDRPTLLLAGGKDKGGGYAQLVAAARRKQVRLVVAFGAAGKSIEQACKLAGLPVQRAPELLDACKTARGVAKPGDVVLLSPACSSFDEFRDYTHRGRAFKDWVGALP